MRAYLLFLEVEPMEVGLEYDHLRLHCTILHWFRTEAGDDEIEALVKPVFNVSDPVELVSVVRDLFGPSVGPRTIPVNHVGRTNAIMALHKQLLDAMNGLGVEHTEPSYTGEGFNPHVTKQGDRRFDTGSRHAATAANLVEALDPETIRRKLVRARFDLGRG